MANSTVPSPLGLFGHAPIGTRCYLWLRWIWTPYQAIAAELPDSGLIFDLGCGHGRFSLAAAAKSPQRTLIGVAHDEIRIAQAARAARGLHNVRFDCANFDDVALDEAAAVVCLDSLHYLPRDEHLPFMRGIRAKLRSDGLFIFREIASRPGRPLQFNRIYDRIVTKFGFNRASTPQHRTAVEWAEIARQAGFTTRSRPCTTFPFDDVLFICTISA